MHARTHTDSSRQEATTKDDQAHESYLRYRTPTLTAQITMASATSCAFGSVVHASLAFFAACFIRSLKNTIKTSVSGPFMLLETP
jgi:uncharacterized membrane protein YjjP (DUF1212 family)